MIGFLSLRIKREEIYSLYTFLFVFLANLKEEIEKK